MTEIPPNTTEPTGPRAKCLLADDDEISQAIVEQILQSVGFIDLEIAPDGLKALDHCMTQKFDLLIVDRKMPHINGDRLIRHLRASRNPNTETPMILFSASTGSELKELGAFCPADLILSKPINATEFLRTVQLILRP